MQQTPTCINLYSYRYTGSRTQEVSGQPVGLTTMIVILLQLYKQHSMPEVQNSGRCFETHILFFTKNNA